MSVDSKIQYRCRRGLLELDVILSRFLSASLLQLTEGEKKDLLRLLDFPDPELLQLVLQETQSKEPALQRLLLKISVYSA